MPGAPHPRPDEVTVRVTGPCRILLVDRQPLFLDALSRLLEAQPLLATVHTTNRSDTALELISKEPIDLVFCEVQAGPISWTELAAALDSAPRLVPLVLLANIEDETLLLSALSSTVAGLFTKDIGLQEFVAGVEAVLAGHRAVGGSLMRRVVRQFGSPGAQTPRTASPGLERLSRTEREILVTLAEARSISEIARSRSVSVKTVRNHVASIYRKLHFSSRVEAMLWAVRAGLTAASSAPRLSPSHLGQVPIEGGNSHYLGGEGHG